MRGRVGVARAVPFLHTTRLPEFTGATDARPERALADFLLGTSTMHTYLAIRRSTPGRFRMGDSGSDRTQEQAPTLRHDIMRPSEYMRSRRPYLFSDSEIVSAPKLTRELLDHQLDTL